MGILILEIHTHTYIYIYKYQISDTITYSIGLGNPLDSLDSYDETVTDKQFATPETFDYARSSPRIAF